LDKETKKFTNEEEAKEEEIIFVEKITKI